MRYTVRSLYLDAQVGDYQARQWAERDSLYQLILTAALRQFDAGEIDFLQKTLVENEAGSIRQTRLAATQNARMLRAQLTAYAGLTDSGRLLPLMADTSSLALLPATPAANPAVAYEQQSAQVAERQAALARSRALPGFSLGYINQGERDSPLGNRFNASIGIPLWAGQYRAGVRTAQAESQAATARADAERQAAALELARARSEALIALGQAQYLEREALPRSRTLIDAATRMRAAGQTDYVTFLRTLDAAFAFPRDYAAQVETFEAARIRMLYLSGQ